MTLCSMQARLGPVGDLGFQQGMQVKWVALDKSGGAPRVVRKVGHTTGISLCGLATEI